VLDNYLGFLLMAQVLLDFNSWERALNLIQQAYDDVSYCCEYDGDRKGTEQALLDAMDLLEVGPGQIIEDEEC
jgi:hypothetical protein